MVKHTVLCVDPRLSVQLLLDTKLLFGKAHAFQLVQLCSLPCIWWTLVNPGDYGSSQTPGILGVNLMIILAGIVLHRENYIQKKVHWNPTGTGGGV